MKKVHFSCFKNKKYIKFMLVYFILAFFFIVFTPTAKVYATTDTSYYICTANFCYLYNSPSFTAEKLKVDNELIKVSHKDRLTLELESASPKEYLDEYDMIFYKVTSYDGSRYEEAYIFSDYVAKADSDIVTYPSYNASINQTTKLYLLNGDTLEESDVEIAKGERVYLYEGYDKDLEFTPIAYACDNSLQYGYVLTETLAPDGVNPYIIYAITIAIACIGIIMALVFMKNKKKKVT